jgi:organic radical activating enzyme
VFILEEYSIDGVLKKCKTPGVDVFLYGAGSGVSSYSKIAYYALSAHGIQPKYFLDDNRDRVDDKLFGVSVQHPDILKNSKDKVIFISSNYFTSMWKTLLLNDTKDNVYSLVPLIESIPVDSLYFGGMEPEEVRRRIYTHKTKLHRILEINNFKKKDILSLNVVDIQVTEKCTMKCRDCSNLMQYYESPKNSNKNTLENSVNVLLDAVDSISDARVIGGEPFLYLELPSLLYKLCNSKKVGRVTIYTNGTFVPKENVLESLKNDKIEVEITDYDSLSKNHVGMVKAFKEKGIRFISHKPQDWTDSSRIVLNKKTPGELSDMFDKCCVNDVLTLLHDRLYHCPFSANSHNLNAIKEGGRSDWVKLKLKGKDTYKDMRLKIQEFYFTRPYQTACKYCLGRDYSQPQVIPAIQVRKSLPITILTN